MPANDTLFTSGTLGRFSTTLNTVIERYQTLPADGDCGRLRPDDSGGRSVSSVSSFKFEVELWRSIE